jgi:hypothetical protein
MVPALASSVFHRVSIISRLLTAPCPVTGCWLYPRLAALAL